MRLQEAARHAVSINRYAEARANAAAILAAGWSGGAMRTSIVGSLAGLFSSGTLLHRQQQEVLLVAQHCQERPRMPVHATSMHGQTILEDRPRHQPLVKLAEPQHVWPSLFLPVVFEPAKNRSLIVCGPVHPFNRAHMTS